MRRGKCSVNTVATGDWCELGRRVLSEASRLAKEQAAWATSGGQQSGSAVVTKWTTDGHESQPAFTEPHSEVTAPVARPLQREARS